MAETAGLYSAVHGSPGCRRAEGGGDRYVRDDHLSPHQQSRDHQRSNNYSSEGGVAVAEVTVVEIDVDAVKSAVSSKRSKRSRTTDHKLAFPAAVNGNVQTLNNSKPGGGGMSKSTQS